MHQTNCTRPWYVVYTKPRREQLVATLLDSYDELKIFSPEVLQQRSKGAQLTPLFPRYLFVQMDLSSRAAGVLVHTPGVIGLVGSARQPRPVADEVISALQEQVATMNAEGGISPHPFCEGDAVLFNAGPLEGLEAVFVGPMHPTQRVQVLLHFLGQEQQVDVDVHFLEKSSQQPKHKHPRRTRGKGRRIHARP